MSVFIRGKSRIPRSVSVGSSIPQPSSGLAYYTTSTVAETKSSGSTVKEYLGKNSASQKYAASAFASHSTSKPDISPLVQQLYRYSKDFQYDLLVEAFLQWTSTPSGLASLRKQLTGDQISYFLSLMVKYQGSLIHQESQNHHSLQTEDKVRRRPGEGYTASRSKVLKQFSYNIREIYNRLIFGCKSENFIYDNRHKRKERKKAHEYNLTALDYENLFLHEFYGRKLDLADMWFKLGQEKRQDVSNLPWIHRFQLYSGGVPHNWPIPTSEVYSYSHKKFSHLAAEEKWETILQRYMEFSTTNYNSTEVALLNKDLLEAIVYSIGYSRNVDFLKAFIEKTWNISLYRQIDNVLQREDPRFPDLDILKAIVMSFTQCGEFYQGMTYINAFQEKYGKDSFNLSSRRAITFWNAIMDGAEKISRFDADLALRVFLQNNGLGHLITRESTGKLRVPTESADFDFEGYKHYTKGLSDARVQVVESIWKLYRETNTNFSPKIYNTKYRVTMACGSVGDMFDVLSSTLESLARYGLVENDEDSSIRSKIEQIHINALKWIIEQKGNEGALGEIPPIIDEWGLNERMAGKINVWYQKNIAVWRNQLEEKRERAMVRQRSETEEDDEGFLGLF